MSVRVLLVFLLLTILRDARTNGIGRTWDVSVLNKISSPLRFFQLSRKDGSPFHKTFTDDLTNESNKRSKRQVDSTNEKHTDRVDPDMSFHELIAKMDTINSFAKAADHIDEPEDDFRGRRDSDKKMEKIGEVKSIDRSSKRIEPSSESWSKQPISIEFRHRARSEEPDRAIPNKDFVNDFRARQAPRIDFITSSRRYSGERESRELPVDKQPYEDYDMHPVFRNYNSRGRVDYQIPLSRAMYLNRYKPDANFYYRVPVDMRTKLPPVSLPYYNRYRLDMEGDDQYLDSYGRIRPTNPTKPKRIIYYATLPEIVRKPIDIRNYPRYVNSYQQPTRVQNIDRNGVRIRPTTGVDPNRGFYNKIPPPIIYKYSNFDNWNKNPNQYEPIGHIPYNGKEERESQSSVQDNKDNFQGLNSMDDNKQENLNRMRSDDERVAWSVPTTSKINVKDNERISGRNFFGRGEGYNDRNRYQNRDKEVVIDQEMSDT